MSNYQEISKIVVQDFENLENCLKTIFSKIKNPLAPDLAKYIFSKSKRIRSLLIFLMARCLKNDITSEIISIAAGTELIHNATLMHDDIIDSSEFRREESTLNNKYNNKLAVIAGDYLLSIALKQFEQSNNSEIINYFASSLEEICNGEIIQFFENNRIPNIDTYIEKSKLKTAILFKTAIVAALSSQNTKNKINEIADFAMNFGIAFQIKDDLVNFLNLDKNKKAEEDFQNGTYTAPIIFLYNEIGNKKNILDMPYKDILNIAKNATAIAKTNELINTHIEKALKHIEKFEDNIYKKALIDLCQYIREVK